MTAQATQGRSVEEWTRALDEIGQSLARRLTGTPEPPPPAAPPEAPAVASLQSLEDRLAQLQARLEQAEHDAAEADAALRTEAESYHRWADRMTAARRRLADCAAGRQ